MMGTWGILLCCVKPDGNFLEIWGSWEPLWEDADACGSHSRPILACVRLWA